MYIDFYQAAEAMHGGKPWWELIGKHLEAYRIHRKVDGLRRSLEDVAVNARIRAVEQGFLAQCQERQAVYDDSRRRLVLTLQLKHLEDALAELEKIELPDGLSPELKEEISARVISRVLDIILATAEHSGLDRADLGIDF